MTRRASFHAEMESHLPRQCAHAFDKGTDVKYDDLTRNSNWRLTVRRFRNASISLVVALSLVACSSTAGTNVPVSDTLRSDSAAARMSAERTSLRYADSESQVAATDRIIVFAGINDRPRNPNSPNFEARRIAAHKVGRWLTDELNAQNVTLIHVAGQPNRVLRSTVAPDDSDGGNGDPNNYGYGTYDYTSVSTAADSRWDMQNNYSDGTSSLWGDYSYAGVDYAIDITPSGKDLAYDANNAATPPPNPNDPNSYLVDWSLADAGCTSTATGVSCPISGSFRQMLHNRWFCGVLTGTGAIGAKYGALQAKTGQPWADLTGMVVGVSIGSLCW